MGVCPMHNDLTVVGVCPMHVVGVKVWLVVPVTGGKDFKSSRTINWGGRFGWNRRFSKEK